MKKELLRMDNISKSLGGNKVLNNVDLSIYSGEIVGLVGENGSGKSTLIKILGGMYSKDSGKIYFEEREIHENSRDAFLKSDIGVVFQELLLVPHLTVAENLFLGNEKKKNAIFLDNNAIFTESKKLLKKINLSVKLNTLVKNLTTEQKRLLQIAKVLVLNPKLIVIDELTSFLNREQILSVKCMLKNLLENGISSLVISSKPDPIIDLVDRILIIRNGFITSCISKENFNYDKIINMIAREDLKLNLDRPKNSVRKKVLKLENVTTRNLNNINFHLDKGEILGIVGDKADDKSELINVIFGMEHLISGKIFLNEEQTVIRKPVDAIQKKIGYIPEGRKLFGLIKNFSIIENITLPILDKISHFHIIKKSMEEWLGNEISNSIGIYLSDIKNGITKLNFQELLRIALIKWITLKPTVLILEEPTGKLNIQSKSELFNLINKLALNGISLIIVSSDINSVIGICDRLLIISEGQIKEEIMTIV